MLRRLYTLVLPLAVLATPSHTTLVAQAPTASRVGPSPAAPTVVAPSALTSPITPRRAFLYSLLVPGAGQAALDRQFVGAVFFAAEGLSLALVHRSAEDLRIARQFRGDSLPETYKVDATGQPVLGGDGRPAVATWTVSRYSEARVRARRTHYEDWIAMLVFNHLFSGADAFVAAQLWDLPARVGVRTAPDGRPAVVATWRFR